jgi:biotin carboxyl carrier protein
MSAASDPRAVRVTVAPTSRMDGDPTITVAPAAVPIEPLRDQDNSRWPLVDGRPVPVRLEWLDGQRAVLVTDEGSGPVRRLVLLGPVRARASDGTLVREAVVDGWRFDIELESERRAALRERARRGKEAAGHSGPLEVHAIIPGRIVAVSVAPGDAVTAGQHLLVLEAMKMQNELRAPREGTIERVAVAVGVNVEVGDLLMVIS